MQSLARSAVNVFKARKVSPPPISLQRPEAPYSPNRRLRARNGRPGSTAIAEPRLSRILRLKRCRTLGFSLPGRVATEKNLDECRAFIFPRSINGIFSTNGQLEPSHPRGEPLRSLASLARGKEPQPQCHFQTLTFQSVFIFFPGSVSVRNNQ
jgi:hypothetical protein